MTPALNSSVNCRRRRGFNQSANSRGHPTPHRSIGRLRALTPPLALKYASLCDEMLSQTGHPVGAANLTAAWACTHNPRVHSLLRRALVALALAPCLVLGPVMPPEHVHNADGRHAHAVAHSHVDFHQRADDHSRSGHEAPELAADDERLVWVASTALNQGAFHLAPNWVVVGEPLARIPSAAESSRQPDIDSSPPHGPPRRSFSLRGPPLASA